MLGNAPPTSEQERGLTVLQAQASSRWDWLTAVYLVGCVRRQVADGSNTSLQGRIFSQAHLQLPQIVLVLPLQEVYLLEQLLFVELELAHAAMRTAGGRMQHLVRCVPI